jgi:ankyrin repeat protein
VCSLAPSKKLPQDKFWKEVAKGSIKNVKKIYEEAGDGSPIINYQDFGKTGETALMMAVQNGHEKVFKYLMDNGAVDGIGKQDKEDWTALMHALKAREFKMAASILSKCKKAKCKPCAFSKSGLSATLVLARHHGERGAAKVFERLGKECPEQLSIQSYTGNTVAHNAAETNNAKLLAFLVKNKAEIDKAEESGVTPFMLSVAYGNYDLASDFLEAGVNVNHKDEFDKTGFLHAVTGAPLDFIKKLIELGADPNGIDKSEKGAIQLATEAQRPEEVVAYIKSVVTDAPKEEKKEL